MFAMQFSQGCCGPLKKAMTEIIPFEPGRVMPPRDKVGSQQPFKKGRLPWADWFYLRKKSAI